MPLIRGLDQLVADLDRRKRPDARARNQVVTKYASIADTVTLSTDAVTTQASTAWNWIPAAVVWTSTMPAWGMFEWQ